MLLTLFSRALSRVSVWHHGQDTGTSQFCVHVMYTLFLSMFIFESPHGAGVSRRGCLNQAAAPLSLFSYV